MLEKEELTGKIINACMEVHNELGNELQNSKKGNYVSNSESVWQYKGNKDEK